VIEDVMEIMVADQINNDINVDFSISPTTQSFIRLGAWKLSQSGGFTPCDREDLEQEAYLAVLEARAKGNHDPESASQATFENVVIRHKFTSIFRWKNAGCRDWRCEVESLDELMDDCDTRDKSSESDRPRKIDQLSTDEYLSHIGQGSLPYPDLLNLFIDVTAALDSNSLTDTDRDLARSLMTNSISEISVSKSLPRSTIYDRINSLKTKLSHLGIYQQ
jgi:hypothetical protein